jgi:hypothetical protein
MKTTANTSHSIETSFAQLVLKEFMKNMGKSFKNIFYQMNEEENCISCQKSDNYPEQIDFKTNVHHYKVLKANSQKAKDKEQFSYNDCKSLFNNYIVKKDSIIENNGLKTTNLKSQNNTKFDEYVILKIVIFRNNKKQILNLYNLQCVKISQQKIQLRINLSKI